ncbi:hypothetical protein OGAPHI_005096 [Ogataea philodendri]|uniref:Uncharacterized protein n=1 Tax=Ogataea philodendri TaxID=1378263 RepID=A0A9P8T368_9ASCO|nr:uncharacterized protein OGAPHI_005096 [Ogataea philodendri]KAH3663695.1 hypothetical protein OGAPHI_005096 [Ogataea philodendri]
MHDRLPCRKTNNLEWRLDKTSGEEVDGLGGVLSVTDVRTLDLQGLHNVVEDRRLADGTSWQTDQNDLTKGSGVLSRLGDSSLRNRNVNNTVWTTVGSLLHSSDNVLLLGEVDEELSTKRLDEVTLLFTTVNTKDSQTHGNSVLNSKGTQSTSSTRDSNNLTWTQVSSLQSLVDSDTSTENRSNSSEISSRWQLCGLDSISSSVLLERTIVGVTRKVSIWTVRLSTLLTEFTSHTRTVQPFDTGQVTDLEVLDVGTLSNNDTSTLVTTNQWKFHWQWPVTLPGVQVGVTDTRVLDVNQNLVWLWSWNWNILVLNWTTSGVKDTSLLGLWDGWSSGVSGQLLCDSRLGESSKLSSQS